MNAVVPLGYQKPELMDIVQIYTTQDVKQQAIQTNQAFDECVRQFLRQWIETSPMVILNQNQAGPFDTEDFIQHGALQAFFEHHDDALERLLQQPAIARHLLRASTDVYFESDAYEPLLAKFEKRIYNIAAQRKLLDVSFRYSPVSRQNTWGDSVRHEKMAGNEAREDIGCHFGTRRSDTIALDLLGHQLRREALFSSTLPIHVVVDGYMEDALWAVRKTTEQLKEDAQPLHCFIIQRRHAVHDRHLGAALVLMNSQQPDRPERIIFCDTLKPNGLPPWWGKFKRYVDTVFPQVAGCAANSDRLEDGGVNLQRLHDGVPIRHQDIDCAFYTDSMARALIQIAKQLPEILISGSIEDIVSQMTARMPEYFAQSNVPKAPEVVREVNVIRRWQVGQEALANRLREYTAEQASSESILPESVNSSWETPEQATACLDVPIAA